jgi:hypothetical protein
MNEEKEDQGGVKFWLNELEEAKKREKEFHKEGKRINSIYECEDTKKTPFNILYSNTDTLIPALYSATPRPVISRRFKDDDPLSKAACDAGERMLEYLIDTDMDGYETYHEGALCSVIDALLPGRGCTRIKYDAEIGNDSDTVDSNRDESTENSTHGATESGEQQRDNDTGISEFSSDGKQDEQDTSSADMVKESELVCVDSIAWDKVLFGYAKKWSRVPWVAFEEIIDEDEAERLFGVEIAKKIQFLADEADGDEKEDKSGKDEHQGGRKTATIYQIWDKDGGRKVRYVSKHYKTDFLKIEDDPLDLTGFFPMPRPLVLLAKSNNLTVTAPYLAYENQAKEINEITRRISKLVTAIKAKALYDGELGGDLQNIVDADDNVLVPCDKSSVLSDGGFDKSLWFMPIEQMVKVVQELYQARDACKQVIYEVTGISDIIRGSTVASETATAQSIKSQWGTMRLKRNQGEVQRYCRDMMRIMLEMAATKFSEESWVSMTSLPYATERQVLQAQQVLQAAQQIQAQYQGKIDPQQIPPAVTQQLEQAQQILQQPKWSDVLSLLKSDMQRSYKIDIETNSTVLAEATDDKQNMNEALAALSGFIKEALPVVQEGLLPFSGFKAILLKIARQFEFGEDIEGIIDEMQQPPPPQPPPPPPDNSMQIKQLEIQAEGQKSQAEHQAELQKLEANRVVEEGRAKTQMHIEQMHNNAVRELEMLRLDSQERMETFKANLDATTRLEIARISAESTIHQLTADAFNADQQRVADTSETDKQLQADLYDADQERMARQFEQERILNQPESINE